MSVVLLSRILLSSNLEDFVSSSNKGCYSHCSSLSQAASWSKRRSLLCGKDTQHPRLCDTRHSEQPAPFGSDVTLIRQTSDYHLAPETAACLEENVLNTANGGHHRSADAEHQDSGLSEMNPDPGWGSGQVRADKDFSEILHGIFLLPK